MTLKQLQLAHKPSRSWANPSLISMTTVDPYSFSSGTGSVLSESILISPNPLHKLTTTTTTGIINPTVRRLWFSRSASSSPIKCKSPPKRVSVSALTSPCKARFTRLLPESGTTESPKKRVRQRPSSRRTSSHSTDLPPSGEPSTDEGPEFQACDLCERLCQQSLDAWMDHLGEFHPIPTKWPSDRADSLTEEQKQSPYSAVVGSHKRRRPHITPRPLNSFMIFAQYLRRATLQLFPDAHNVHLSQRIGLIWRQLDSDLREQYATEASRLQRLHAIEFPDYKYQPKKRIRETDPETGTVTTAAVVTVTANPVGDQPTTNQADSGPKSEWDRIGHDSPDGPIPLMDHNETHPIRSCVNEELKLSRSVSAAPQLISTARPRLAYVFHSTDPTNRSGISYISNTVLCVTDTDYGTSAHCTFEPYSANCQDDLPVVQTKQVNETLTALVSENQMRNVSEPDYRRRSSSFLGVLPNPVESWTQEKSRPKALEDLLNGPSLFQSDATHLQTLNLEPLTVVTHVSPRVTVLDPSDSRHSHLKLEECELPVPTDSNLVPAALTPSLSTISPDSSLGQQDSVSLMCGAYWDRQKRVDQNTSVMLLAPTSSSSSASSKTLTRNESSRTVQYCPNITWNNTEAMQSLGDIAMLIETGSHDPRILWNKTPVDPCSTSSSEALVSGEENTSQTQSEFANIDTCGTSPSLEDLGQLVLFSSNPQELENSSLNHTRPVESIVNDVARTDEAIVNTNEIRCLPSISSWTFGGSLSR